MQQPPASNLNHTKPQGYKSTSIQSAITGKPTNSQHTTASSQQPTYNLHSRASSHQAICMKKTHVKQPVCSWLLARWHNVHLVCAAIPAMWKILCTIHSSPVNLSTSCQNNQAAAASQQPKAYKATRLQVHKPTQCNHIQVHEPTAYNSKQPATNIRHTFRSKQPPSNLYEEEPCKASCVLLAAGQLAQREFGVHSHPSNVEDPTHHPSSPVHLSTNDSNQTGSSHQPATKSIQSHKTTSPQAYKVQLPTSPQTDSSQQPATNNQHTTYIQEPPPRGSPVQQSTIPHIR